MIPNQPPAWNIGLSAWIIQDGNYPDFAVDETVEFGVEFHWQPGTAVEACDSDVLAAPMREATYQVVAEKIRETDRSTVLDIGILVYSQFGPQFPNVEQGSRFRTELWLGVDPYGSSPLVYSWRIASILKQTASFIETASPTLGGKVLTRDRSKPNCEETSRTDAWNDDNGRGEYILRCELLRSA